MVFWIESLQQISDHFEDSTLMSYLVLSVSRLFYLCCWGESVSGRRVTLPIGCFHTSLEGGRTSSALECVSTPITLIM